MEVRDAKYNKTGGIDCEINHPEFGWIPFTAREDDVEEIGRSIFSQLIASGNVELYEDGPGQQEPPEENVD